MGSYSDSYIFSICDNYYPARCRFGKYLLPFSFTYIGLFLLSAIFSILPMLHNPFFEGTVRIQKEKNHRVINSGLYRIVRHPGYLGMVFGSLPIPFAFGSVFSFIPVGIMIIIILIRTYNEDKTLQIELDGYKKYRLIPLIW